MSDASISLGKRVDTPLGKHVIGARLDELLRIFQFQTDCADFDKFHALGLNAEVPRKDGWDSPESREQWAQSECGPRMFQQILACVDARAAVLTHPRVWPWLHTGQGRGMLGTRTSQAFFTDSVEIMALMFWRYGASRDVEMLIGNTMSNELSGILNEITPPKEVLELIRPRRSHYIVYHEDSLVLSQWVDKRIRPEPSMKAEEVDGNLFKIAVEDGERDRFFQEVKLHMPKSTSLVMDFKSLAVDEFTLKESPDRMPPWAKLL